MAIKQKILKFNVSMTNTFLVHIPDRVQKLTKIKSYNAFIHRFIVDELQKGTMLGIL